MPYACKPSGIDLMVPAPRFWNVFLDVPTIASAVVIIRHCLDKGDDWVEFTQPELDKIVGGDPSAGEGFWFDQLVSKGWVTSSDERFSIWAMMSKPATRYPADMKFKVTPHFVAKCHTASPKK